MMNCVLKKEYTYNINNFINEYKTRTDHSNELLNDTFY